MQFFPPTPNSFLMIDGGDTASGTPPRGWNSDGYESAVLYLLRGVQSARTGEALLGAIRAAAHSTGRPGGVRAFLHIVPDFTPNRGAHARCVYLGINEPTVFFTPAQYHDGPRCGQNRKATLIHELVHGLRWLLRGQCYAPAALGAEFGGTSRYPDEEEFFAVLVQNIYGAGIGLVLRAGYDAFETSDPTFLQLCQLASHPTQRLGMRSGQPRSIHDFLHEQRMANFPPEVLLEFSRHFAGTYFGIIERLSAQTRSLSAPLGALDAHVTPFNPLRDIRAIQAPRQQSQPPQGRRQPVVPP